MPAKARPDDWERLFSPNAPKRGGPLRVLMSILIFGLAIALLGVAAFAGLTYRRQIQQADIATATANVKVFATRTAVARETASARALAAQATVEPPTPAEVVLGNGSVVAGGNLRNAPRIAPDTVVGLIYPGDQVVFLEQQLVGGDPWFRVRVSGLANTPRDRGVDVGAEGWASASLLSPPAP